MASSNPMGYFLGRALAALVIVPLGYYLITIIYYSPNKVSEEEINKYINNNENIKDDSVKSYSFWDQQNNDKIGLQLKTYTVYRDKSHTGIRHYSSYVFYSDKYHKYFEIMAIAEGGGVIDRCLEIGIGNILIVSNKKDFNNPAYGTIDNPVPVFKFVGAEKSIR
ncbi:MAG: hypothetical protein LBE82_11600, partial [Chitinophagaceae bacterium]|nr:hypothetical protein [Chitinophagaceae bacterium]